MITFSYQDTARIANGRRLALYEYLEEYREHLLHVHQKRGVYSDPESSIVVPYDEEMAHQTYAVVDKLRNPDIKCVFVVGIGGSNLGAKAIYDALGGVYDAFGHHSPQLIFLDTINERMLERIRTLIDEYLYAPHEIVISINTKSGTTTETLFNAEILLSFLSERLGSGIYERVVVTGEKDSSLASAAGAKGAHVLVQPDMVGGRFSVFTPVGLFPLALAHVDVESLRAGARSMIETCLQDSEENIARVSATLLQGFYMEGKSIHDTFLFDPALESLGKWYRQLMGESIGKEKNLEQVIVHAGMTPTVSVGSTDLHSIAQLYLGGPKDKITTFVSTESSLRFSLPEERFCPECTQEMGNITASEVLRAIFEGTKVAYKKEQLPFMEVALSDSDAYTLGEFLQFKMVEMMYLGKLMNVNTFDQPSVEKYKEETRHILKKVTQ